MSETPTNPPATDADANPGPGGQGISDSEAQARAAQTELGINRPKQITKPTRDAAFEVNDGPVDDLAAAPAIPTDLADAEAVAAADPRSKAELLAALTDAEHARDEAIGEAADYLDKLQRTTAEFVNFRKRTTAEKAQERDLGRGDVITRLLDVLDDFDRTIDAIGGDDAADGLAEGVGAVHRKLVQTLTDLGVSRIDTADVPFDPTRHDAVMNQPADEPLDEPEVAQVMRPGYALGDRVLRPAMVAVRQ